MILTIGDAVVEEAVVISKVVIYRVNNMMQRMSWLSAPELPMADLTGIREDLTEVVKVVSEPALLVNSVALVLEFCLYHIWAQGYDGVSLSPLALGFILF